MKKPADKSQQQIANSQQPKAKSQQQIAVMLELLRSAVLDRDPVLDPNVNVDWDDLMDRASKQGVLAWVYDGICKLPEEQQPPRQQRINWALSAQEIWDRYHKQKEVLADMVKVCDENGMRMLHFKGFALSELYPNPKARAFGDLDIFLFGEYQKGNKVFGGSNFEETVKRSSFDICGVHIENHRNFLNTYSKVQKNANTFILAGVEDARLSDMGFWKMSPICSIVYQLMHIIAHVDDAEGSLKVRMFVDFGLSLQIYKNSIDMQELANILNDLSLKAIFSGMVVLSERLLRVDLESFKLSRVRESLVDRIESLLYHDDLFSNKIRSKNLFCRLVCVYKDFLCCGWLYVRIPSLGWTQFLRVTRKELSRTVRKK